MKRTGLKGENMNKEENWERGKSNKERERERER